MILGRIILYFIAIVTVYFIIILLGMWVVPYTPIKFCKMFYRLFPATAMLIAGFSLAYNEHNIRRETRIKKIIEDITKYDLTRKRLKRIKKLKK